MLLFSFLLFLMCEGTVSLQTHTTNLPLLTSMANDISTSQASPAKTSPLKLVAKPDYPVAAGQEVHLYCIALPMPDSFSWYRHRQENQTWEPLGHRKDLILTKPEQSGMYQCSAQNQTSSSHHVYIVSIHATVGEKLGIAAFFFSLLALMINFLILFWLCWQRCNYTPTTSSTAAKGFPGPEKPTKGSLPTTGGDGDVYMNYTRTNQAYSDLEPSSMTGDNVYSSLS